MRASDLAVALRPLALLIATTTAPGCAIAFHDGNINGVDPFPPVSAVACNSAKPVTVALETRYQVVGMSTTDDVRQSAVDNIEAHAEDVFTRVPCFRWSADPANADLVVDLRIRDDANPRLGLALLSGFTLMIVPARATDSYTLTAEIKKRGTVVDTVSHKEQLDTWLHLLAGFGYPFASPKKVSDDMWEDYFEEIAARTLLVEGRKVR